VLFSPPLCYFFRFLPKHYTDHSALNTRCSEKYRITSYIDV
jgi:hypothetical protein